MSLKITYLLPKAKAVKLFQWLCLFIILGCGDGQLARNNDFNGTESDFVESFQFTESVSSELDTPTLLVDRSSGKAYTGNVDRIGEYQSTSQKYLNGLLNGKSIKKSPDGSWVEAQYLEGKLHGPMRFYDADGIIKTEMFYEKGKLVPVNPL